MNAMTALAPPEVTRLQGNALNLELGPNALVLLEVK
jgi:hypothetical protein